MVTCVYSVILMCFLEGVLNTLIKTMSLLRRCRVNPALSIQLFFPALSLMGALDLEPAHRAGIHAVLGLLGQNSTAASDARGGLGRKTEGWSWPLTAISVA